MQMRAMSTAPRSSRRRLMAGLGLSATLGTSILLGLQAEPVTAAPVPAPADASDREKPATSNQDGDRRFVEIPESDARRSRVSAQIQPIDPSKLRGLGEGFERTIAGACPDVVVTHSEANFEGGEFVVQAGFAEGEIAAASFTLDPDEFPIKLELAEIIFATSNAAVQTTTEWSILIFEGTPDTGELIEIFSSDDVILPHIVLGPGTQGVNVQFLVDPNDPDQIFITNDGSNTFTIGWRIDAHNAPSADPCFFPPNSALNAFPTTDTMHPDSPDFPSQNWLYALPECPIINGWLNFSSFPALLPGGDWNIRFTYSPTNCEIDEGACCLPDGSCEFLDEVACADADGMFMGADLLCDDVVCPEPVGACCIDPGQGQIPYCEQLTEAACDGQGGYWFGGGVECAGGGDDCPPIPSGACCFEFSCADLTEDQCTVAGGFYGGDNTECSSFECNPEGACCLQDGSCVDGIIEDECTAQGGVFQGTGTSCDGIDCPDPLGACCLDSGNCIGPLTEANCVAIPGATWAGVGTTCDDVDCTPVGACCLDGGACFENQTESNCLAIPGATWAGPDTTCDDCGPNCPADLNDDQMVNVDDLLQLLGAWGSDGGDVDGNGTTDVDDLLTLLGAWGPCA